MPKVSNDYFFQPSNFREFSTRLDDQILGHKNVVATQDHLKSELVRVDVSGKSFARMRDYRR